MNIELINEEASSPIVGPGSRLRIAREEIGLSVAQVSSYLHLTSQLIRDIENDDYSRAPQVVFMRGYLRSYAKLVDLVGDEIIAAFNELQLATSKKSFNSPQSITLNYERESVPKSRRGPIMVMMFIPLLIIVLWLSHVPQIIKTALEQKVLPLEVKAEIKPQEEKSNEQATIEPNHSQEPLTSQVFDHS